MDLQLQSSRMDIMDELHTAAKTVNDRDSFVNFVTKLCQDLKTRPTSWENRNLEVFLEALGSWVEDMDGYYENMGREAPKDVNWKVFADALMAARIYE